MTDGREVQAPGADGASPKGFEATGVSVSLTATDLRASVAWYKGTLGFSVEREFEREGVAFAARLRAGAIAILVTQDTGERGAERVKGEGFSIQFTTRQNVDELAARAKAAGAKFDTEPADVLGARVFRLRDPDGFKLVISSER